VKGNLSVLSNGRTVAALLQCNFHTKVGSISDTKDSTTSLLTLHGTTLFDLVVQYNVQTCAVTETRIYMY
jgi:hypothetical protein